MTIYEELRKAIDAEMNRVNDLYELNMREIAKRCAEAGANDKELSVIEEMGYSIVDELVMQ